MKNLLILLLLICGINAYSQCPTGTPPTLTCGTDITVGPNSPSGLYGAVSQNAPSCAGNDYSYSDIFQTTYQPGQSILLDHTYTNYQNAEVYIEILDASSAGCPTVACNSNDNSGVGGISATSFTQNPNTGYNNSLISLTLGLDELGLTPGQTVYIKIATKKKTNGQTIDQSASGSNLPYTISCISLPENSCENNVFMAGDQSYIVDNQYASDNFSNLDTESSSCGYTIENNVMFQWCTDQFNTSVEVVFNSVTINEPTSGSLQFAILEGPCGGPYTRIQCNSGINSATTIPINPANTQPNTCYWIMMDGTSGTWWTVDMTLQDANPMPLPIELIAFTGKYEKGDIKLSWTSASESNNEYYTVERSLTGESWESIGRVDGAVNSTQNINYNFIDSDVPQQKYIYYRLSQTDFNGQSETFKIISVNIPIKNNKVISRYDLMGKTINDVDLMNFKGVYIEHYEDGSYKKIMR